jgi:aminomethyltransferase
VGHVTSGTLSPILKKSIAMGYLYKPFFDAAKDLSVEVRGKRYPATLTKMPFVPTTYKKLDKKK